MGLFYDVELELIIQTDSEITVEFRFEAGNSLRLQLLLVH